MCPVNVYGTQILCRKEIPHLFNSLAGLGYIKWGCSVFTSMH